MKLLSRYNQVNITVTIVVMMVAAIAYYIAISFILSKQLDKALGIEETEIFDYVKLNNKLPQVFKSDHQQISFIVANGPVKRQFIDTTFVDYKENEVEPARAIISKVNVNGTNYRILVILSTVETEDLIQVVFYITIGLISILLIALLIINRLILGHIWKPFYQVLEQLKVFNLADNKAISNVPSNIDEFMELDQAVITMAERVKRDYQNLKFFTENASHELMTPISVINSKLDTLVQTDEFTDKQSKLLNDIYYTVTRLTRLNKSMLLLAKIENGLIQDNQEVDIKEVLEECMYQHEEMISQLNITMVINLHDNRVHANKSLMEILLNNLLSNAIRHNYQNGELSINLDPEKLTISNSGNGSFDFRQVLKRFHKSDGSDGIGLGLTLCKQICDNYGFKLDYEEVKKIHTFSIIF